MAEVNSEEAKESESKVKKSSKKTKGPKCIRLVLTKFWFDMIKADEKHIEFRSGTPYYDSRLLYGKPDEVEFSCGYTNDPDKLMRFKIKRICRLSVAMDELFTTEDCEEIDFETPNINSTYAIELGERLA